MPIYEYRCADCGATFEVIDSRPRAASDCPPCLACAGGRTERRPSRISVDTPRKSYHPAHPADV
jgi:putative FmdB family regulatory protein